MVPNIIIEYCRATTSFLLLVLSQFVLCVFIFIYLSIYPPCSYHQIETWNKIVGVLLVKPENRMLLNSKPKWDSNSTFPVNWTYLPSHS